jgi:hypothetical protein
MAVYKIFPTQDATLYSAYPNMNTGIDEIIEATTNFKTGSLQLDGDLPQVSRFLIQFNSADMAYVSASLIGTSSWTADLRVFVANVEGIKTNTTVLTNAVSQSWNMGTGRFLSDPEVTNGTSWIWADESGSVPWAVTGGAWISNPSASQTFSYRSDLDLNFGVKSIVEQWNSGSWKIMGLLLDKILHKNFYLYPTTKLP